MCIRDRYVALTIPSESVPTVLIWILAFLSGMLAGALWGAIPGLVKAYLNINEVLACIMTNWIAANLVTWFFDGSALCNTAEFGKTGYVYKTSYNGVETFKMGGRKRGRDPARARGARPVRRGGQPRRGRGPALDAF